MALACDLVHHRRIGRPKHQHVGIAESVFVFFHHADDGQGAFPEQNGLPNGSESGKEFVFDILVDDDDLRVFFHIVFVKQPLPFPASVRARRNIVASRVQRSGQVGIVAGQRAAARSHGRGGSNALFGDDFCVAYGQGFNPAAAPVAEAAPWKMLMVFVPIELMSSRIFLRTIAQCDDGDNRSDTDDDAAEHRQKRTHFVRQYCLHRHSEVLSS